MLHKRFWKGAAVVSGEMLVAMAIFTAVLTGLIYLIRPFVWKYEFVDVQVFNWMAKYTNESMNRFMRFITYFAQHSFLIPVNIALILYFLLVRRHSWFSVRVAAIALTSLICTFVLKGIFMRDRPEAPLLFTADGYSFPSGHAFNSITFYGLLIYISSKTIKNQFLHWFIVTLLVSIIFLVGLSRIYLRVHYASDVAVGFITGLIWLLVSLSILKKIEAFNKQGPLAAQPEEEPPV